MYQNLYRKYRPNNFEEVVGQKVIIRTLKNAITNDKLSHAYLLTGPRGTGKTSIAKILARTVNCENLIDNRPCNNCVNCTQNSNNPIDILEIDAASNNGVDEIRELKSKVNLVPSLGKYKIYIIDEVHMLSIGAFNALLKTLEEPPKHVIFILATTDPHKIPATILSRCQRFDLKKLNVIEIAERLKDISKIENIEISDEAIKEISFLSDGAMRDALSILDQALSYSENIITIENIHEINGTITKKEIENFIKLLVKNDIEEIFNNIDLFDIKGKDFIKLTEEIIEFLRNILLKINVPKLDLNSINYEIDEELIKLLNNEKLLIYIKEFNNNIFEMKNSNNPRIIFELLIIKIMDKSISKKEILEEAPLDNKKNSNLNIENIKKIRINNTLCLFNKKELSDLKNNLFELKQYLIDDKFSKYVQIIIDGELKAVGNEYLIFMFESANDVEIFNNNLKIIEELLKEVYKMKYKPIAVNKSEWDIIRTEFNNKEKKYNFINE